MKRMRFQHHDSSRLVLAILVGAGLILAEGGKTFAGENFHLVKGIDGFAAFATTRNVEPVSISDAESTGADGAEKLAWGQTMLEELERLQKTARANDLVRTEDVFSFRDWCIEAPGRGNLLLAIAAEETAVTMLFQALAEDQTCGNEVRRRFARCLPNGLAADYWLETLAMEGIVVDCGDALKASDPEYIRLGAVLQTLFAMLGGWHNPLIVPKQDGTWNGCTDAFAPGQLTFRTMSVVRMEIALEVCLEILDAAGSIPDERTAFIAAAEKYAEAILDKRNRATSTITPHEVWRRWETVLAGREKTGFAARVEGMWRAGDYAGVMDLARERLAADPNDLAGLLLKFEYESEYLQLDAAVQTAKDIIAVASRTETERFAQVRELVVQDARSALELLPQYPPEELAKDLPTVGLVTNKALPCGFALRALEADGLFREATDGANGKWDGWD